jgi:hypothetical protein
MTQRWWKRNPLDTVSGAPANHDPPGNWARRHPLARVVERSMEGE